MDAGFGNERAEAYGSPQTGEDSGAAADLEYCRNPAHGRES
jgi:hypothetical protein